MYSILFENPHYFRTFVRVICSFYIRLLVKFWRSVHFYFHEHFEPFLFTFVVWEFVKHWVQAEHSPALERFLHTTPAYTNNTTSRIKLLGQFCLPFLLQYYKKFEPTTVFPLSAQAARVHFPPRLLPIVFLSALRSTPAFLPLRDDRAGGHREVFVGALSRRRASGRYALVFPSLLPAVRNRTPQTRMEARCIRIWPCS